MSRVLEGRNRASADEAASFIDLHEELEAEVETLKAKYMNDCKAVRKRQEDNFADAKSQGVAKKVVKAIADARRFEKKAKAKLDSLEDDDQSFAVDIRKALGDYADLPLGQAAVTKDDDRTKAVVSAVKSSLTPAEQEAWDRAAPKGSA